tara:strand:+ start:1507 stop:2046 length:540 start_codon:yes stop_codon:yes gene_type:complete
MPRKERMWHAEHFGEVTEEDAVGAAKEAGEAAKNAANSEEAKVTGEIAKDSGKEILRMVKEGVKILSSSTAGIAIFSGIILAMEKTLSPEQLFKTTRIIFIITTVISFGGAIVTYLMNIAKQTSQTKEFQKAGEVVNDASKEAEAEVAVQADLAEDVVEDTSVEDVTEAVSTTTEDVVS